MFGLIVVVASWRIDRLENLHINPWSIPALLPGMVGGLIILLAIALAWQARTAEAPAADGEAQAPAGSSGPAAAAGVPTADLPAAPAAPAPPEGTLEEWGRTLAAAVLCVLFAGISLGHGLPFVAEAATFVFLFTAAFSWPQWRAEKRVLRGVATTLAIAVVAAAFIAWLFESVFLVRLP